MARAPHVVVLVSCASIALGGLAIVLGALGQLVAPHNRVVRALADDEHYKYLAVLVVPTTAYFVIANWVGWQYYRNS